MWVDAETSRIRGPSIVLKLYKCRPIPPPHTDSDIEGRSSEVSKKELMKVCFDVSKVVVTHC